MGPTASSTSLSLRLFGAGASGVLKTLSLGEFSSMLERTSRRFWKARNRRNGTPSSASNKKNCRNQTKKTPLRLGFDPPTWSSEDAEVRGRAKVARILPLLAHNKALRLHVFGSVPLAPFSSLTGWTPTLLFASTRCAPSGTFTSLRENASCTRKGK
jgi:hypothetical protein